MRRSNGSSGFERKVHFPSKTFAMYEPSGFTIASSKPKKTKSWQRLVQVNRGTRNRGRQNTLRGQYGRLPVKNS